MFHLRLPDGYVPRSPSGGIDHGQLPQRSPAAAASAIGSSGGLRIRHTPVLPEGSVGLLRQVAFKGEALVPVVPTAFAVILLPDGAAMMDNTSGSDKGDDGAAASAGGDVAAEALAARFCDFMHAAFQSEPQATFDRVRAYCDFTLILFQTGSAWRHAAVLVDASSLAADDPAALADVYMDGNNVILDVITAVTDAAAPFEPSRSQQHAVALPCDPRSEPVAAAPDAWYALPTCLACLDRLDRYISGLHPGRGPCRCGGARCRCHPAFAAAGVSCRACRAVRGFPQVSHAAGRGAHASLACETCGVAEDLWACLVCGHMGCSRYRDEHAKRHWEAAGHDFALSTVSQQVWDYAADALAHRLIVAFDADDSGAVHAFELPGDRGGAGWGAGEGECPPAIASKLQGFAAAAGDMWESGLGKTKKLGAEAPWASEQRGGGGAAPTKYLVDAKVESKMEEMCLDFSRQLAQQLEAQRRQLGRLLDGAATVQTVAAPGSAAGDTASVQSLSRTTASEGLQAAPVVAPAFALYDSAVPRIAASWAQATAAAAAVQQRAARADAEVKDLEAEEQRLDREQEELKAQLKASLLARHQASEARKARVRELTEMITEAQLNLDARRRVAARGLSAADQQSSFAAALPANNNRRRSQRR